MLDPSLEKGWEGGNKKRSGNSTSLAGLGGNGARVLDPLCGLGPHAMCLEGPRSLGLTAEARACKCTRYLPRGHALKLLLISLKLATFLAQMCNR